MANITVGSDFVNVPANRTAIQNAVNSYAGSGIWVKISKGNVVIGDGQEIILPSGTRLMGSGMFSTMFINARTTGPPGPAGMLRNLSYGAAGSPTRDTGIKLKAFGMNGVRATLAGFNLTLERCDDIELEDLYTTGSLADGIHINGACFGMEGGQSSNHVRAKNLYSDDSYVDCFAFDLCDDLVLENLRGSGFGVDAAVNNGHGLTMTRCNNFRVLNSFFNGGVNGVDAAILATGIMNNGSRRGLFENVLSHNNVGNGYYCDSSGDAPYDVKFKNCHFFANTLRGISLKNAWATRFDRCSANLNTLSGFYGVNGCRHVTFRNCEAYGNGAWGINDWSDATQTSDYWALEDCELAGNTSGFYDLRTGVGAMTHSKVNGGWTA